MTEQQVETPLLSSKAGAVLTLLNWRESPVAELGVRVRLDYDVDKVTAIQGKTSVHFTSTPATPGEIQTLATAPVDLVIILVSLTKPSQLYVQINFDWFLLVK